MSLWISPSLQYKRKSNLLVQLCLQEIYRMQFVHINIIRRFLYKSRKHIPNLCRCTRYLIPSVRYSFCSRKSSHMKKCLNANVFSFFSMMSAAESGVICFIKKNNTIQHFFQIKEWIILTQWSVVCKIWNNRVLYRNNDHHVLYMVS